ncbi:hypothetical protein D9M69_638160 [compost metagenome]
MSSARSALNRLASMPGSASKRMWARVESAADSSSSDSPGSSTITYLSVPLRRRACQSAPSGCGAPWLRCQICSSHLAGVPLSRTSTA